MLAVSKSFQVKYEPAVALKRLYFFKEACFGILLVFEKNTFGYTL